MRDATQPSTGPRTTAQRLDGPIGRQQCRVILREMVRAEHRIERLNFQRRRRLVRYAASLGIGTADADRIIDRALLDEGPPPAVAGIADAVDRPGLAGVLAGVVRSRAAIVAGAVLWSAWLIAQLT